LDLICLPGSFQSEDGRTFDIRLEYFQSPQHVFATQDLFLFSGQNGISNHAGDALASQYPIGANHLADIRDGRDLNDRDTCFFNTGCDRCPATSA
jgi:hypothetical protein